MKLLTILYIFRVLFKKIDFFVLFIYILLILVEEMTDNSNVNKVDKSDKPAKKGRPLKNDIYKNERVEVLNKLLNILGITDTQKVFFIDDIQKDDEKVTQILNLQYDIKKYFNARSWTFFLNKTPVPWLSLTKSVLKACGKIIKNTYIHEKYSTNIIKKGLYIS